MTRMVGPLRGYVQFYKYTRTYTYSRCKGPLGFHLDFKSIDRVGCQVPSWWSWFQVDRQGWMSGPELVELVFVFSEN